MKRGIYEIAGLPSGSTRIVDPRHGELDFGSMSEETLAELHSRGCSYVRIAERKKAGKKGEGEKTEE